jgi:hypothetical protein
LTALPHPLRQNLSLRRHLLLRLLAKFRNAVCQLFRQSEIAQLAFDRKLKKRERLTNGWRR